MTREEFRDLLRKHDWFFAMSDDPRVYAQGLAEQRTLDARENDCTDFRADRAEVNDWLFNGAPWGTPERPKPDWWDGGAK